MGNMKLKIRKIVIIRVADRCKREVQNDLEKLRINIDEKSLIVPKIMEKFEVILSTIKKLEEMGGNDRIVQRIGKDACYLIKKLGILDTIPKKP